MSMTLSMIVYRALAGTIVWSTYALPMILFEVRETLTVSHVVGLADYWTCEGHTLRFL